MMYVVWLKPWLVVVVRVVCWWHLRIKFVCLVLLVPLKVQLLRAVQSA